MKKIILAAFFVSILNFNFIYSEDENEVKETKFEIMLNDKFAEFDKMDEEDRKKFEETITDFKKYCDMWSFEKAEEKLKEAEIYIVDFNEREKYEEAKEYYKKRYETYKTRKIK